jgi:hypothetical protein
VRGEGFGFAYAGESARGGCEEAGGLCEEAWLKEALLQERCGEERVG